MTKWPVLSPRRAKAVGWAIIVAAVLFLVAGVVQQLQLRERAQCQYDNFVVAQQQIDRQREQTADSRDALIHLIETLRTSGNPAARAAAMDAYIAEAKKSAAQTDRIDRWTPKRC